MRCSPVSPSLKPSAGSRAFTLAETLITTAIAGLVLAVVCSLTLFSARSFVGIGHYIELDQASRHALDTLSRAIRQTAGLKQFTPTSLTFTNLDNSQLVVTWDPRSRKVTQTKDGIAETLLTECDYLRFNMSQRNPSNGVFGFYAASSPTTCKLVDISWRCSRTMLGKKFHTESVQTAKIVIRN